MRSRIGWMLAVAAMAACAVVPPSGLPVPGALRFVRPGFVAGPRYEGCAVRLDGSKLVTCAHVVPADATEYTVGKTSVGSPPIASGRSRAGEGRIVGDWTLLCDPDRVDAGVAVDFRAPIEAGEAAWIVGWKRREGDGAAVAYERAIVPAKVGRRDDDGFWCLVDIDAGDYAGLSGAPVVCVRDDVPVIVGMYCGYVATRESVLGIGVSERVDYVFIRPDFESSRR